jgi:protein involved in polysaccharide export with SLBB domain
MAMRGGHDHMTGAAEANAATPAPVAARRVRVAPLSSARGSGRRRWRGIACGAVALALIGCSSSTPDLPSMPPPPQPHGYSLTPGDVLSIKFYHAPELNEDVVVRPDGNISMQLIGDVPAAGLTVDELGAALTARYAHELTKPRIAVIVRTLGAYRVVVGGEVGKQGPVPLSDRLTLFSAIQEAGGFLPTAHRKSVILIRREAGGHAQGYEIDTRPIADGDHPDRDVPLQPFDIVYVPRSKIANVDLFVKQYIRDVLPIDPALALPVF